MKTSINSNVETTARAVGHCESDQLSRRILASTIGVANNFVRHKLNLHNSKLVQDFRKDSWEAGEADALP